MKIKIAHLYYDLMNLYGENGNVRALKRFFELENVKVEISFLSLNDKIDFNKYDIFYMGMGSENNQMLVLNDILKYKEDISLAIEKGKYFFMTGNSYELFGNHIEDFNGNKIDTLDIFDYYTKVTDIKNINQISKFRIVGDIRGTSKLINEKIIGFQNRSGNIYNIAIPFIEIIKGTGNKINDLYEGFNYKNFYGTYIIGPLFIRNPYLTYHFVKEIILTKDKDFKFKIDETIPEIKAYNKYLENFPN